MKNELNTENFRMIPYAEQQEINGGAIHFFVLIGVAAVSQIITDWDNFKNGLMGRPEVKNVPTTVIVEQ